MDRQNAGHIQTVDRALDILEHVGAKADGLTLMEIAGLTGLGKATTWRFVNALCCRGYIRKEPDSPRYKLGLKILSLTSEFLQSVQFREVAVPYLRKLQEQTGESANLAILDESEIVYIDRRESPNSARAPFRVGKRAPVHCTSLGKAMLAYLPVEEVLRILPSGQLPYSTPKTITDISLLLKELSAIRESGIAVDDEEHQDGIRCIGAPVFDITGKVIAAISIGGQVKRITQERIGELSRAVLDSARAVSAELGWKSPDTSLNYVGRGH